ncbi:MAG: hypothetical protein K0S68_929 [Candidatus Saccharibacteria bacterium]|jgi:hypothetical protein|nr:hypothetical protein [Candidatus Saccharibacteria bacterium]
MIITRKFTSLPQSILMAAAVVVIGVVVLATTRAATNNADLNNDGTVSVFDLSILLSKWGTADANSDISGDGAVNVFDLSILLARWAQAGTGPTPSPSGSATPTPTPTPGGITFNHCTNPTYTVPADPNNPNAGKNLGGYFVDSGTWNFANYPTSTQTMYICNFNNWYVDVSVPSAGNGDVKTYPNTQKQYINWTTRAMPRIDSFTSIMSTFAHTAPATGDWNFAYDIWINEIARSGSTELMIWTQPGGVNIGGYKSFPSVGSVTLSGITYDIKLLNGNIYFYVMRTFQNSGTVNILEILNHMMSKGWIPTSSTLGAIDYGVEVNNTNSTTTRFELNNFSITDAH